MALPLDHLTYSSPLARNSPFRRDLDRWDWGGLGADFDDFLCYNGVENSAHGVKTRGKSKPGASDWPLEVLYRPKVRHPPQRSCLDAGQN